MKIKTEKEMYESYKMLWMISHRITMEEISIMADQWRADCDEEITFEEYLEEFGFGGEIWPCFEEFVKSILPTINKELL